MKYKEFFIGRDGDGYYGIGRHKKDCFKDHEPHPTQFELITGMKLEVGQVVKIKFTEVKDGRRKRKARKTGTGITTSGEGHTEESGTDSGDRPPNT